jgi:hypothetical protein
MFWITRAPELQMCVVLLSSPATLIAALWGMTSKDMLQQLRDDWGALFRRERRTTLLNRSDLIRAETI